MTYFVHFFLTIPGILNGINTEKDFSKTIYNTYHQKYEFHIKK